MENNILDVNNRIEFREWLSLHADSENECWVELKRGKPTEPDFFYYLDAVEEALCFGWIDSTHKVIDGRRMQRFTPRKKNSPWTELKMKGSYHLRQTNEKSEPSDFSYAHREVTH